MKFFALVPEAPITEEWAWQTDVLVSTDGTEQRISLCEFPKRSLNLGFMAQTDSEVRSITNALMNVGDGLLLPFYQAATRLTGGAAIGAGAIAFNAGRTDVRDGEEAILFDHTGRFERVRIAVTNAGGATLVAPLAQKWSRRASIAPVWAMYASGNMAATRNNPDNVASMKGAFTELEFMEPFLNEFAPADITMFAGLPVLESNSVGTEFEQSYVSGSQTIDYGMVTEIRKTWLHSQIMMPRNFLCQRVLNPASWRFWRRFANYVKGSAIPFYLPTFRQDFDVVAMPVAGGNTLTYKGHEYNDDYAPFEPFKQFAFFLEGGGVHYAKVSNCVIAGANTLVTFAPALPTPVVVSKVSLLLKVRIADDKISCQHENLHTMIAVNIRTAD